MGSLGRNASQAIHTGLDIPGGDLPGYPVDVASDPNVCREMCTKNSKCDAWAYGLPGCGGDPAKAQCWLKGSGYLYPALPNACRDYGIVRSSGGVPVTEVPEQVSLVVTPSTSSYTFSLQGAALQLNFTSPFLPQNDTVTARQATYITAATWSTDGASHDVQLYFDATGQLSTDGDGVPLTWSRVGAAGGSPSLMRMGATTQQQFSTITGDRASYGYTLLLATDGSGAPTPGTAIGKAEELRSRFAATGTLPDSDLPCSGQDTVASTNPVLAVSLDGKMSGGNPVSLGTIVVAHEQEEAIDFFGEALPPMWVREPGIGSASDMARAAMRDVDTVLDATRALDADLTARATKAGGEQYAQILALAYRQAYAATILVWVPSRQTQWQFLKEISSDGDISTVDVIFPAAPLYALMQPDWLWQMLEPLMAYSNNETNVHYNLPWAPHHLGHYPVCNLPPNKQEQMPLEESGNMLIMLGAIAAAKNSTDFIPEKYWPILASWAHYVNITAKIPGDQLSTDDFLGKLKNASNLAAKGYVAMGAYSQLLRGHGDEAEAQAFWEQAQSYVPYWDKHAYDPGQQGYMIGYNQQGTWTTLYNLLWQSVVPMPGPGPVPASDVARACKFYEGKTLEFGLPLESLK